MKTQVQISWVGQSTMVPKIDKYQVRMELLAPVVGQGDLLDYEKGQYLRCSIFINMEMLSLSQTISLSNSYSIKCIWWFMHCLRKQLWHSCNRELSLIYILYIMYYIYHILYILYILGPMPPYGLRCQIS